MLNILTKNNEQDWKQILSTYKKATIFHTLEWRDCIEKVYKFKSNYLIYKNNNESAIVTLFKVNNIFSGKKLTNMPYNFYPEPLFDSNESLVKTFDYLNNMCKNENLYAEIKTLNRLNSNLINSFPIFETKPFINSILYLEKSYQKQQKNFSEKFIKNLRTYDNKRKKVNFTISLLKTTKELENYYDILCRLYRDKHMMPCHPYSIFKYLLDHFIHTGKADILIAKDGEKIISGIVVLKHNSSVHYIWSATDQKYYNFALNDLLLQELVIRSINAGYDKIDFGTTSPSDKNLSFFKSKWGCTCSPVYYYYFSKKIKQPDYNNSFKNLRKLYRYTPVSVIKKLMPYIVRQLA